MPKLIDESAPAKEPIGKARFLSWIDDMNRERARRGINERYQPISRNGELTFEAHVPFKWKDRHLSSPSYATATAPVPHWQDREVEPA